MDQDFINIGNVQVEEAPINEPKTKQSHEHAKVVIKVNCAGTGMYGLSVLNTIIKICGLIWLIIAFIGFVMYCGYDDSPFALTLCISGIILGINCFLILPFIKGFKEIVKNARYQRAVLEQDYEFK